jgi:putative oxidoreductase
MRQPNWARLNRWLALAVRLYLGWLFLDASWHKIAHPASFALDVATYQFLPLYLVNVFAIIVPWVEAMTGVLLLVGARVRAAALLVVGMMIAFMIALAWALHLGLDMSCGCFASQGAVGEDPISGWTMLRDSTWLAMGLYVLFADKNPLGMDSWMARGRRPR